MPREKDTYLNKEGLQYYHNKVKAEFATKTELNQKQDKLTAGNGIVIDGGIISVKSLILNCGSSTDVV